jgi:hypothetical protein
MGAEAMTDRKALARIAVLQKAILNILEEADQATRDELKTILEPRETVPVRVDGTELGIVRVNKETVGWEVFDWGALERWVQEHVPSAWVTPAARPQIASGFVTTLKKEGKYIDADGVVHEVPGLERRVKPGNLNVVPTDAAEEWAREVVGLNLKQLEDGAPPSELVDGHEPG